MRLKPALSLVIVAIVAFASLLAPAAASAHGCGRIDGTKIRAYNLGCRKARSIYGRQPPKGWTATNVDVAGGLAFYCRVTDEHAVDRAIDRRTGRVHVRRLHGAPLIIARVRYGE